MIATFLKFITLTSLFGAVVYAVYHGYRPIREAIQRRYRREIESFKKQSTSLLKQPEEREIRIQFGISFGLLFLVWLLLFDGILLRLISVWPFYELGWRAPIFLIRYQYQKRVKKFQEQLVDMLTLISNCLKSGLSLMQGFSMVAHEMPDPTGAEFRHLLSQHQMGQTIEAGLNEMMQRLPLNDFQLVVQAILTLRETGGNMAETFDTMTATMRERQKVHGKIRSLTSQGMAQSVIISAMPPGLLLMFSFVAPDFVKPLFSSGVGWFCLGLVALLQVVGGLVMRKIISIRV